MELTHKNLTLKELSQLALVQIYDEYQKDKGNSPVSMKNVCDKIGLVGRDSRIFQITDFLEQSGYIEVEFRTEDGMAYVNLLPNAIIYLEETGDTSLKNTGNKRDNIVFNFFNKVENSQFNSNSQNITQNNNSVDLDLLERIIEEVKSNNEISLNDKKDLFADLQTIKNELSKSKPDKTFIEKKLELMSKFIPLIPLLPKLKHWIETLF